MCEPLSIAAFALTTATTLASYGQQKSLAKANEAAANKATVDNYASLSYRQLQERVSENQQQQENSRNALKARATAAVGAGEAGVSGNSVSALMADLFGQEGRFNASVAQQADFNVEQLQAVKRGEVATNMNRKLSIPMPSFASAALRIGTAGVGNYGDYRDYKDGLDDSPDQQLVTS